MRIAIIAFNNLKYCPYINPYKDFFETRGVDCDIIFFDRENIVAERKKGQAIAYDKQKKKIINFLRFAKETKRLLRNIQYDFVVVLTTIPGVLLTSFLRRNYKNKYLVDIRDYTYEKFFFYRHLQKKLFQRAKLRVISSPGFVNFLPKNEYVVCHNTTHNLHKSKNEFCSSNTPIVIGYVGTIAYAEKCKKMIDLVKEDDRFVLHFYGNVRDVKLIEYAKVVNSEKIKFFGAYDPKEKEKIINNVDILFNMYGNESLLVKYALSNKLYDSFYYKKPLITSPNTEMAKLAGCFSYSLDNDSKNLNGLFDWYNNINKQEVENTISCFAMKVEHDRRVFEKELQAVVENK